jgi:alkyl sulfatase BDS1-like metallo-beta-lactamase superfamily hydrolase
MRAGGWRAGTALGLLAGLLVAAGAASGQQMPTAAAMANNPLIDPAAFRNEHFSPLGKPPSAATLELRRRQAAGLPFSDTRDMDEAKRGFLAPLPSNTVMADAGHIAWDLESYKWLLQDREFTSIHPSLQRMARLNMNAGLYEVLPGRIYQVRGLDLSNITFIKGDTGWIIFDPLITQEVARFALKFVNEQLGARPVKAVIYSHNHIDHFGGVRGVADEADVRAGRTQIIAPAEFLHEAISENVFAGNAMTRRSRIQYATILRRSPFGHVDQSLGKNASAGMPTVIPPTTSITKDIEELTVDGVRMVFQNTPHTEAPANMHTYFPEWKAFWPAENVTATIHNVYTLRGAPVRDAMEWSKQINRAIHLFPDMEVMFASHHWPRWGNARALEVLRAQRDVYANMHQQSLHLANQGVTVNQVHNIYEMPRSLQQQWAARSYHGALSNNVRAIINRYLGYWDGNPANLEPPPSAVTGRLFVEMMGAPQMIARGRSLNEAGRYRETAQLLQHLVFAEPANQEGRQVLADAFEQLGYQSESTSFRNSYLQLAGELRTGLSEGTAISSSSPDIIRGMTTGQWLDFLGISMDGRKADGMAWTINLITPDNGERYKVEMSNATLTNIEGFTDPKATLTITLNRSDLNDVMMGNKTFEQLEKEGRARFEGDRTPFNQLASMLTVFTPDFEIFPGTANTRPVRTSVKPFQFVVDSMANAE